MSFARYIAISLTLFTSLIYVGVDIYHIATTKPSDHIYPIFYSFTVIWAALEIITSIFAVQFLIFKCYMKQYNRDSEYGRLIAHQGKFH